MLSSPLMLASLARLCADTCADHICLDIKRLTDTMIGTHSQKSIPKHALTECCEHIRKSLDCLDGMRISAVTHFSIHTDGEIFTDEISACGISEVFIKR